MERSNTAPFVYSLMVYACGFFLFLEWMYPLHILGTTDHFFVFLLFAELCFLISFLRVHWIVGNGIKAAVFMIVIQGLFYSTPLLGVEWIISLIEDIQLNITYMWDRDFHLLTSLFRTFLFMLLIWLMSYLLYYWFVTVKKIAIFSICTFAYVGLLDTFTPYDGNWAIARVFLFVAIAFSLTNLMKDSEEKNTTHALRTFHWRWLLPIIAFPFIAFAVGFFAPKTEGEWQDPIAHITHYFKNDQGKQNGGLSGTQKSGYGDNDEHLGGAFEFDDTPIFQVDSEEKRYWRVESKDIYTGKGWVAEEREDQWTYASEKIPFSMHETNVHYTKEEATIIFEEDAQMNKIVYPYGIVDIATNGLADEYLIHQTNGTIQPTKKKDITSLASYTIQYNYPIFQADALKEIDNARQRELYASYTQVPESLPERVHELAEEITERYDTQYDKVQAIEQYFSEGNFIYETDDVSIPDENTDYVDEFLFDTQAGYCDNFSSSMVVMLRTLDIPTRWVKGFTGGSEVESTAEDEAGIYEITNANAHSWVEVYFPGSGWVPFEPTIGFSNETDIEEEGADSKDDEQENIESAEDHLDLEDTEDEADDEKEQYEQDEVTDAKGENAREAKFFPWFTAVLLLGIIIAAFTWRDRLMMVILSRALRRQLSGKVMDRSMRFCLYMCRKKGLHKETSETMRTFSHRVDTAFGMNKMNELTGMYEQYMYSKDQQVNMHAYKTTWDYVIKQMRNKK